MYLNRLVRSNFAAYVLIALCVLTGCVNGLASGLAMFVLCTLLRVAAIDPRTVAGRAGDYFDQCLPTLAEAPDSSGTSLTRYTTHALTPEEFVADGISENLRAVYGTMAAAIMRGYQPNMLDMVLFGRLRDYSMHLQEVKRGYQSIIQPFVTLPKEDVVNTGAFIVTAGAQGAAPVNEWILTVENGNADFQNQDLPAIDTQFIAGDTLILMFVAPDGSSQLKQVEVISSVDATVGDVPAATVQVRAPYLIAQWNALTAQEKALWQPTGGLVMFSGNSTSNYRSRCNQKGLYNSRSLAHYWFQTQRKMFQWTDEYEAVNDAKTMSEFFKAFLRIPLAKQIQTLDVDYMRELANNLFWGQPFAGQSVETWQNANQLPLVYDLDGVTVMDVETRIKGVETQLDECGRVIDMLGAGLNIDTLRELLPIVARNRAGTGAARDQVWDVDMLVSPTTASLIQRVMAAVYKDEWGVTYMEQLKTGTTNDTLNKKGVWANTYDIPGSNLKLNVVSGFFLEDLVSMAPAGHKAAANYALIADFTDIDWFVMEQKKRVVEYPPRNVPIEATKCLIDYNVRTIKMESMTHGIAVKRPARHLIVKGFSETACPVYTPTICAAYEG